MFKNEELTLADLAAELGVTSHQLSEMCNAQLNTSFPKLLAYHRVQEARHLLEKEGLYSANRLRSRIRIQVGFQH